MDCIKNWLSRLRERLVRFAADLRGVSTVEYALIVVGIIGIVGVATGILTGAFTTMFETLSGQMTAAAVT